MSTSCSTEPFQALTLELSGFVGLLLFSLGAKLLVVLLLRSQSPCCLGGPIFF